jgi:LysM repeat protein
MHRPWDALRLALRPSSVLLTVLLLVAVGVTVGGHLATRPIVRLEVDTGRPIGGERLSPPPTLSRYRVQPGDTLSEIAELHDVDAEAVAGANGLVAPYDLVAGDVLRIPDVAPGPPPATPPTARTGIADLLASWARRVDVGRALFQAVAWRESSWRQDAVSIRGAVGVGQVLPQTAAWIGDRLAGGAVLDPHNLEQNVELSARYLRWLIDRYEGDLAAALAAYHQGPEALARDGWYPSTIEYVGAVFRLRRAF